MNISDRDSQIASLLTALGPMAKTLPEDFIMRYKTARIALYPSSPGSISIPTQLRDDFLAAYEAAGDAALADYDFRLQDYLRQDPAHPEAAIKSAAEQLAPYEFYGQKLGRRLEALQAIARSNLMTTHAQEFAAILTAEAPYWAATDPESHHGAFVSFKDGSTAGLSPSVGLLHQREDRQARLLVDLLAKTKQKQIVRNLKFDLATLAVDTSFDDVAVFILQEIIAVRQPLMDKLALLETIGRRPNSMMQQQVKAALIAVHRSSPNAAHLTKRIHEIFEIMGIDPETQDALLGTKTARGGN